MLHHYYYVNGQRVSMEYYLEVVENNSYTQAVFKKAKEYFEKRPMEWQYLCHTTPEKMLAQSMIVSYENTSEGEAFRKEWYEKARNNTKRWYIFIFLCIIAFFCFVAWGMFNIKS